jgi:site-specific recombinase XerD
VGNVPTRDSKPLSKYSETKYYYTEYGKIGEVNMLLVADAVEKFMQYLSSIERSQETISGYRKDLASFHLFLEKTYTGTLYVEDVTDDDIEEFLVWLKDEKKQAPASRSRKLYALRSFCAYAYKKKYVDRNVALSVEGIKLPQKERTYLSEEEVMQLAESIEHPLIQLVVHTLYYTGLRISECLDLTLDTVDLDNRVIRIISGKGNKDRQVPISEKLHLLLQQYVRHLRPQAESQVFFVTLKTGKLSPVYVNRILGETVKKLGWKKQVTAHILRHSFASQLVKKDVNIVHIQKLLGHSSLKVTSIYTHSNLAQMNKAVNVL